MRFGRLDALFVLVLSLLLVSGCTKEGAKKEEPAKREAKNKVPDKAKPEKAEPDKAEPEKAEPEKAEPDKAGPEKAEPDKAEPEKAEPEKAEAEAASKYVDPANMPHFAESLHKTGAGMKNWYEKEDGFMSVTGIPYANLDCSVCHVKSCDKCHGSGEGEQRVFSLEAAQNKDTCLACHTRAKKTFAMDGEENLDVHIAAGMNCSDCHKDEDVHGDGKSYFSMRDAGGVTAACTNCHKEGAEDAPEFTLDNPGHRKHRKDLDCTACHVRNTLTCNNCHFDSFLAEKSRKGNFIPAKDYLLLVNHEGKVTAGTAMTLVHEGKKFVTYAPYFTHSVMSAGRKCEECHGLEVARKMRDGEKIKMSWFKDGKPLFASGIIPLVPELLDWTYFDKKNGAWTPIEGGASASVQLTGYAEPLTAVQIRKLAREKKQ